jgi:hypothetical protein
MMRTADEVFTSKEETLKSSGEEEYQRFMGFPLSLLSWLADRPEESQTTGEWHYRMLFHPIAWVRWRIAVRRMGPYARDFEEFRRNWPDGA